MIWHDFMITAKGDSCDDFTPPTEPAEFSPFFGKYASTGASGTSEYYSTPSTGGTTADPQYDPRFYEEAPLDAPETEAPPEVVAPEPTPTPAPGNGNGNGNANGQQGGASPG
jgi:hypothetical protein